MAELRHAGGTVSLLPALDQHPALDDSWRRRFDSLVLFTPREISALPDLAPTSDPTGYPPKDEMGDYLELYARELALPVITGEGIARLSRVSGRFITQTDTDRRIEARSVVVDSAPAHP